MRIVQVGKFYSPVKGGMERVVQELSEGLAGRGHAVRTIVASKCGQSSQENVSGVDLVRLRTHGNVFSQPLIRGLKCAIEDFKPDLVQFHLPNPLAARVGWPNEIPTCATLHAEVSGWRGAIDNFLTQDKLKKARALIFSSTDMRQSLVAELRMNSVPLKVIPFGFRFDYLCSNVTRPDHQLVLFVGRLVPYKGVDVLIEAIQRCPAARLAIIGDGPMRSRLERQAKPLGQRVRFLGDVDDAALAAWYQTCSVYAQPSISDSEAFGVSMLEAMHFARPVVSTDLQTGVRQVNIHQKTGLVVPPQDATALALAIKVLLRDHKLALSLGRGAARHCERFRHDLMIDAHLDLYKSLVDIPSINANVSGPQDPSIHM